MNITAAVLQENYYFCAVTVLVCKSASLEWSDITAPTVGRDNMLNVVTWTATLVARHCRSITKVTTRLSG
jgi:hypothetical protein